MALFNWKKSSPQEQNIPEQNLYNQSTLENDMEKRYVEVAEVKVNNDYIKNSPSLDDKLNNLAFETYEINSYEDAPKVADLLFQNGKITISLLRLVREERIRTLDFLSGIIYASHGRIDKVGNRLYTLSLQTHVEE